MEGTTHQKSALTSHDASSASEQRTDEAVDEHKQQQANASCGTTETILRETGDQIELQKDKTMSLAAMVDSLDDDADGEKSQDQYHQQTQKQQQQETISQQVRQGQQLSTPAVTDKSNGTVPACNLATKLNQQTDPDVPTAAKNPTIDVGSNNSALNESPKTLQQPQPSSTQSATKLNGLKNRQRPPPLVLDRVSNFYDSDTNGSIVRQHTRYHHQQPTNYLTETTQANNIINANAATTKQEYQTQQDAKNYHQVERLTSNDPNQIDDNCTSDRASSNYTSSHNNNNSNANQKFWASLNENASRNRALANARSVSSAAKTLIEPTNIDNSNPLGPDLIIKQRNSGGSVSSSLVVSTLSARKHHHNQFNAYHSIDNTLKSGNEQAKSKQFRAKQQQHQHKGFDSPSQKDALNNSDELDDCLVTGDDNNAGGNLVGVENTTPPATDLRDNLDQPRPHQLAGDEPPASATSSRPRSNNPFLDDNDEDFEEYRNSIRNGSANRDSFSSQDNNFQKRPASFIAATDRMSGFTKPSSDFAAKQRIIEEKLSEFQISDQSIKNSTIDGESINPMVHQHQVFRSIAPPDQLDSQATYVHTKKQHQFVAHYESVNDVIYGSNNNTQHISMMNEPKISMDSETTVCQPPPCATMQLPHWSEAIYELNNAILETSSIVGGAENGQFINIVENGDVILELDSIKVSGYTLVEFNELVQSKQFHLLKAIQTKHSRGLALNLKDYLALSFPKNSKDKKLQALIRDNIYRQTIPCTTRPPKSGEVDKVDYHFLTKEQFAELNRQGALLECGVYVGHFYGTLKPLCDINQLLSDASQVPLQETYVKMRRAWDENHPAVEMIMKKDASIAQATNVAEDEHPLYENHESLRIQQPHDDIYMPTMSQVNNGIAPAPALSPTGNQVNAESSSSIEALPPGWERVTDQTHGTYYIDHNTQRTQYEQPYEVELTKGSMGFGFTLVEADSGLLLVRSVIPGGPASMNGLIRPGDILISAIGVSVTGLLHTDIAKLFSMFAVGDRARLTFARSNYVLDENLIPDEYLFSNGTNGDLAIAVNPNNHQLDQQDMAQNPHILVNQEFEFIKVTLKRGDQGFGFTISDSIAGQKVRKIQNHEICSNLKQGDILINLNGEDITKLTHKDVVERLKKCPPGDDVALTIKRRKRFRSKTPMAMHTDATRKNSLDNTPQRNCKTPSLDGLMLRHPTNYNSKEQPTASRSSFPSLDQQYQLQQPLPDNMSNVVGLNLANGLPQTHHYEQHPYGSIGSQAIAPKPLYGENTFMNQQPGQQVSYQLSQHILQPSMVQPSNSINDLIPASSNMRPSSNQSSNVLYRDNLSNSVQASETSVPQPAAYHANSQNNNFNQVNQYNNFMNNDKLVMMQMQHPRYQQPHNIYSSDYHQVPLYSNSEIMNDELMPHYQAGPMPALPSKPPLNQYWQHTENESFQNNFYANNEEIALQSMQYGYLTTKAAVQVPAPAEQFTFLRPVSHGTPHNEHDEFEYHSVDLERENTDSNWGIRLIGGAEVDRAISIGSMIFDGVAAKSGKLKSGDEIISIDGVNVIGATHKRVVDLISACTNRVSLVVRRKTFAEACDVVLTKNLDEGFGFVIISNENCALIGKIIEGSPADRCKQLRVRDCIIAVNGRYITPDMKHPEIVNMIKDCGSTLRLRIIPVDCYTVKLIKDVQNDSFGFRMRGGSEYDGTPLYIVRVEPNGQAQGLLNVGDQILEINNIPTVGMTHQQAATIIKYSDPIVKLKLRRNYVTPPSLLVDSPRSLQKYNQTAEIKQVNLASTPIDMPNSHDASFSSLPPNVNLMNQKFQQSTHLNAFQDVKQDLSQSIYDHHPMTQADQSSLYAT